MWCIPAILWRNIYSITLRFAAHSVNSSILVIHIHSTTSIKIGFCSSECARVCTFVHKCALLLLCVCCCCFSSFVQSKPVSTFYMYIVLIKWMWLWYIRLYRQNNFFIYLKVYTTEILQLQFIDWLIIAFI